MTNKEVNTTSVIKSYKKTITRDALKLGLDAKEITVIAENGVSPEELSTFYNPAVNLLTRMLQNEDALYIEGEGILQ
jgi:hypothetical protein